MHHACMHVAWCDNNGGLSEVVVVVKEGPDRVLDAKKAMMFTAALFDERLHRVQ